MKEPGPDMKVISVMSCQVLRFSASFSLMKPSNCSARSLPNKCLYSPLSSFKMVSGVLVSRYSFMP